MHLVQAKELYRVLALSSEIHDKDIVDHLQGVQKLTEKFMAILKQSKKYKLTEEYVNEIVLCSVLHDIGKSGIPESILYKPGPLSFFERKIMEMHPLIGVDILLKISKEIPNGFVKDWETAINVIRYHHEKWDGTGYPMGLKREQIPLEARIIAIVDVYDALIRKRSYKNSWTTTEAIAYLVDNKGIHFDPYLVEIFIEKVLKDSKKEQNNTVILEFPNEYIISRSSTLKK